MWPTAFALMELTAANEARIGGAREGSGELRTEQATGPRLGPTAELIARLRGRELERLATTRTRASRSLRSE